MEQPYETKEEADAADKAWAAYESAKGASMTDYLQGERERDRDRDEHARSVLSPDEFNRALR